MTKKSIFKAGDLLIYFTLIITFILWIFSKNSISEIWEFPILSVNQLTALLGTVLFSWSFILSTRLDFLEKIFAGADRVYRVHRRSGEIGAILILTHVVFLILNNPNNIFKYLLPIHSEQSVNFGIYAFWIFAILIFLTLFIRKLKIPYHLWKQTHKFINLAMILAFLHIIAIQSDTSTFLPLGIWMDTVAALGIASGLYKTFFYSSFGPRYEYTVESIRRYNGVHDVQLKATAKKMPYEIAQYAYVSFESEDISKESHPYCVASVREEETLRFCIKELGDYTSKLGTLKAGDKAVIWGAHGNLGKRFQDTKKDAIFIAGGIGIAAFLSMYKKASREKTDRKVSLFYCTKYKNEAVFEKELMQLQANNKNLHYHNQCSREVNGSRLSAAEVKKVVRDIDNTIVYLCGPKKMMKSLSNDLVKEGFSKENMVFEDFEML